MTRSGAISALLGLRHPSVDVDDPVPGVKSLAFNPSDGTFRVVGYTPAEAAGLLSAYREHMTAMVREVEEHHSALSSTDDAVRYRPESGGWPTTVGPEDVLGEHPGT